jgi:hypothetical protein
MVDISVRAAWYEMLRAAMTLSLRSVTGAATERTPSSSSRSTRAKPWERTSARTSRRRSGSATVREVSDSRGVEDR